MVLPTVARGVFGANLVFVWDGARGWGEGLIFVFQEFSASINKAFILAVGTGRCVVIYSMGYGHFRHIS